MADLVYPKLSYEIVGVLFDVYNELGCSCREKYYQRAVEHLLLDAGFEVERELRADLKVRSKRIGYYFLDFLIEGKVVLELKAKPRFRTRDFEQVKSYLSATDLKLGLLANFGSPEGLVFHRILNSSCVVRR